MRKQFKENVKHLMFGIERRKLHEDIREDIYTIPHEPFKEPLAMVNTGFSFYQQRQLRGYVALFTADFYRLYDKPCPLCVRAGKIERSSTLKDGTDHILLGMCVIEELPEVQVAWADIVTVISSIRENNPIVTGKCSIKEKIKFLLNPTFTGIDELSIPHEDLQVSGLDDLIRKFFNVKYQQRYNLLKKEGFIVRKK